jgi:hypothetical protein
VPSPSEKQNCQDLHIAIWTRRIPSEHNSEGTQTNRNAGCHIPTQKHQALRNSEETAKILSAEIDIRIQQSPNERNFGGPLKSQDEGSQLPTMMIQAFQVHKPTKRYQTATCYAVTVSSQSWHSESQPPPILDVKSSARRLKTQGE